MTPRPRKPASKIRAVIYTRVSTDSQAESGLSLEHQLEKCRALAVVNDYDVIDVITDAGESAASLDRPGMARVLGLVSSRKIEAVLIAKLDRLTRSVRDLADVLDTFARHHCALVSASESLNTETAAGRMVVRLMAVVSEWEREAIGERTRDALSAKRQRGELASRHAPLGYRVLITEEASGKKLRTLTPDTAERTQLEIIAECRAAGFSWDGIAQEMNRLGHTNRAGRPWKWQNIRRVYMTAIKHGTIDANLLAISAAQLPDVGKPH